MRRGFNVVASLQLEPSVETGSTAAKPDVDPALVATPSAEKKLIGRDTSPIGSRRRRQVLQLSPGVPFEQLPYQCFQEARKILQADREEKLHQIEVQRARLARLLVKQTGNGVEEREKQNRVSSMRRRLEKLKIFADINDPLIKKRFEDGQGDMNRPIYRYLADREWRSYRRPVMMQRLTQMSVVPDVFSDLDPTAEVRLAFKRHNVQPGAFVESRVSEVPAKLNVRVFDKGERLVTVAVVDPDVPDVEQNGFRAQCHFLAVNIPISPTSTSVPLSRLSPDTQQLLSWLPPHAQKGSPYHRLSVFVLQQPREIVLEPSQRDALTREAFRIRGFRQRHRLKPVGAFLFRTKWDEGMAGVMERAGIPGADIELKRKRVYPLKRAQLPLKKFKNRLGLAGLPSKRLKFGRLRKM